MALRYLDNENFYLEIKKDYWDLTILFERELLDDHILAKAIVATFQRRNMQIPKIFPVGLSKEFAQGTTRQALWRALLNKNNLAVSTLMDVISFFQKKLKNALAIVAMFE